MTDPLRIAVLNTRLSRYGGAEGFAWRLAEALAAAGYAVDFICARAESAPPAGVRPVVVGRVGPLRWLKVLWSALAAERARGRGGYDLAIGLGKTLRQDVMRMGGGPLPVFWRLSRRAWEPGWPRTFKMLRRRLSPSNWIGWWIEREQARTTPVIVANSHLSRQWMVEAHPHLRAGDIRVIFNRPDLSRFSPMPSEAREELRRAAGIADGEVAVLTAGTNFALKGTRTLIRALARLPGRFRLLVAGGRGADDCLALARSLGVEERVHFLGRVDDMRAFYNTGDIFVLPTFYDACSNAVMEALACGIKTVSSASNGSAYFLPADRILGDPASDSELASLLLRVEGERAPGGFSWPAEVRSGMGAWVELVDEVLTKKEAAR